MAKIATLKLPKEVIDYKADYEEYNDEMEYVSPEKVSKESIKRIKAINQERGFKLLTLFEKDEKLAA